MLIPVRTGTASVARTDSARWPSADVLALAGITVIGVVLRFATIAHQSYWVDEATTVHEIRLSLGGLLHAIRVNESTPPLYYLAAWVWAKVFGTGEAGLRALSALAGSALIPIAYLCARELSSRWAGVLTALLAAVSPFLIWYSQEARAYMLFATLCGLSFLFFARLDRRTARRDLIGWSAASVLALSTHFFAGFLIAPEALWLLWRRRDRATVAAVGVIALAQAAFVPLAASDSTRNHLSWIKAFSLSSRIQQVPVDFGLSQLYKSSAVSYGLIGAGLLALVVAALLIWGLPVERRRGPLLAAGIAAFVILVPIALALLGHDYLVSRNLIAAWVPLAVVLAAACTAPRTLPAGAALATLLVAAFLYSGAVIDSEWQYQRPDWRGVARALGPAAVPRAIVAYDAGFASQPLAVYLRGVPWQTPSGKVPVREIDVVGSSWQDPPPALPSGMRVLSNRTVAGFRVLRFAVPGTWLQTPQAIGARANSLLPPAPAAPVVLIQHPS